MVALERPQTVDRYTDVVERDLIPSWMDEVDDQRSFRDAAEGTIERQIWDRAVDRGIEKSVYQFSTAFPQSYRLSIELISHIRVNLLSDLATDLLVHFFCRVSRMNEAFKEFNRTNVYVRRDDRSIESIRSFIGSALADEATVKKVVTDSFRRLFETSNYMKWGPQMMAMDYVGTDKYNFAVDECMANFIAWPYMNLIPVPLHHYRDLLLIMMTSMVLAFVIFMGEAGSWEEEEMRRNSRNKVEKNQVSPAGAGVLRTERNNRREKQ